MINNQLSLPTEVYGQDTCFAHHTKKCKFLYLSNGMFECSRFEQKSLATEERDHPLFGFRYIPMLRSKECLLYETPVIQLHRMAEDYAVRGDIKKNKGEEPTEEYLNALELEEIAARKISIIEENCEPVRSILFYEAASLAYKAGEHLRALELIELCLSYKAGEFELDLSEECELLRVQIKNGK